MNIKNTFHACHTLFVIPSAQVLFLVIELRSYTWLKEKNIYDRVQDYYRGERISNALLFLIGGAGLVWTFLLFFWRQGHLSTGLFISTIPLSFFFIITGLYRFVRSFKRYKRSTSFVGGENFLLKEELPHLEAREVRFKQKRRVDLIGICIGFCTITLAILAGWNHIFLGTSISLLFFSSFLLIFDLFGQYRTSELLHHLHKLN